MASAEVVCSGVAFPGTENLEQMFSTASGLSSETSCLTITEGKSDTGSPRSTAEGASKLKPDDAYEVNADGCQALTTFMPLHSGEVVLPEGFDDSTDGEEQFSDADKWADILDCSPEEILNFSYDDIAGPINDISLPDAAMIAPTFPEDAIPENDMGEVMDWDTLSLPDIYDICPAEPSRAGDKRKALKIAFEDSVLQGFIPMRARSKRARGGKTEWAAGFLSCLKECSKKAGALGGFTHSPSQSAGSTGTVVSSTGELFAGQVESALSEHDGQMAKVPFSGNKRGSPFTETGALRRCSHCSTTKTPQWRAGPNGPKTLCNACGVRYKSGRLCAEYRPASSPEFEADKHSNSHRKIVEMRKSREGGAPDATAVQTPAGKPPVAQRRIKKTALQGRRLLVKVAEPPPVAREEEGPEPDGGKESMKEVEVERDPPTIEQQETTSDDCSKEAVVPEPESPSDLPISKICVRVMSEKSNAEASLLSSTSSSSCLVELGSQPLSGFKQEFFSPRRQVESQEEKLDTPALISDGASIGNWCADTDIKNFSPPPAADFGEKAAQKAAEPVLEKQQAPATVTMPEDKFLGASSGSTLVNVVKPSTKPSKQKAQPKSSDPKVLEAQRQQHLLKLQRQRQARQQQKQAKLKQQQQQQQAHQCQQPYQQQQQMVYYSTPTMVYSPGLPQVPFSHHQGYYPMTHQQLLLQQQISPQPLSPQPMYQQHVMIPRQQYPPSPCAGPQPCTPPAPKMLPPSPVTPGALSIKKQDHTVKPLECKVNEQSGKEQITPSVQGVVESQGENKTPYSAASIAGSPLSQVKPNGDTERLREQLRRRQELGQSIRRQLDNASLKPESNESENAAESLPISVAFGHGSPKAPPPAAAAAAAPSAVKGPARIPPLASQGNGSVRKIGPHLFRRSAAKPPISSVQISAPQQAAYPSEPRMEAPWEDLGSDRVFGRVEA